MSLVEIRLEIIKVLIPTASRMGVTDPANLIDSCRKLEEYVIESQPMVEETPDSTTKRPSGRPRKEKPQLEAPDFLTPPNGG